MIKLIRRADKKFNLMTNEELKEYFELQDAKFYNIKDSYNDVILV